MLNSPLLQNPKVKIALIIFGLGFFAYLGTATWLSKVRIWERGIQQSWVRLSEDCGLRVRLLPEFEQLVQYYAPQAQDLVQTLNKTHEKAMKVSTDENILNDPKRANEFSMVQKDVATALLKLSRQSLSYPTLSKNQKFLLLGKQLLGIEGQIAINLNKINIQIEAYNGYVTGFPQGWVNQIFFNFKLKTQIDVPTLDSLEAKPQ